MTGDEVISQTADPHQHDASPDPADPAAERLEVTASDLVATSAPVPAPPAPEETNGSQGAGIGGDVSDEPIAGGSHTDDAHSDGGGAEPQEPLAGASAIDDGGSGCDDDEEFGAASVTDDADLDRGAVRRELVRQFEAWLDRMEEGEPPPEGLPEELLADALETPEPPDAVGTDLYTVFAGLTKLSGEIGLQGRAFRQLADVLAPSVQVPGRLDRIEAAQNAIARELARRAEPDESELPAPEDVLSVLFDLYDRLNRGLQNFDASYQAVRSRIAPAGFLQRLRGGKQNADPLAAAAAAMREGYRLTLSRLETALLQWGIQRAGEVGEPFDPERMAVVDVGSAPGVPDGSVLEVYRSGYVLNGRVLATARVKVAKAGSVR